MNDEIWIFGYGSLIWKPGFSFTDQRIGYIRGWLRRFYQGSTDHRGVPGAPGRVVTLLPEPQHTCWGVAFRVADDTSESVLAQLDYREKGGFRRYRSEFYTNQFVSRPSCYVHVYVAENNNPNYLGPASMLDMARQICNSQGPSGSNIEYVVRLAESLRAIGVVDEHVFELEQNVRFLGTHNKKMSK